MVSKKTLLYVSPVIPASTGAGRVMRAYHALKTLSTEYHIYLLVISVRKCDLLEAQLLKKYCNYKP